MENMDIRSEYFKKIREENKKVVTYGLLILLVLTTLALVAILVHQNAEAATINRLSHCGYHCQIIK